MVVVVVCLVALMKVVAGNLAVIVVAAVECVISATVELVRAPTSFKVDGLLRAKMNAFSK